MRAHLTALMLLALLTAACGDDTASDAGPGTDVTTDTGTDAEADADLAADAAPPDAEGAPDAPAPDQAPDAAPDAELDLIYDVHLPDQGDLGDGGLAVCAKAQPLPLSAGAATVSGEVLAAETTSLVQIAKGGCVSAAYDTPGAEHLFAVTLQAGTSYLFKVLPDYGTGSSYKYNLSLYLFTSCADPAGSCVAGADAAWAGESERFSYKPQASGTYYLGVDSRYKAGDSYSYGKYTLHVLQHQAPTNDACQGAQKLSFSAGQAAAASMTELAADDVNLPSSGCVGQDTEGADLFYKAAVVKGKKYRLTVTPEATFNVSTYVLGGCAKPGDSCVAGADKGASGAAEQLVFLAETTGDVVLGVDSRYKKAAGQAHTAGSFTLLLEQLAKPPNDTCAGAKALAFTAGSVTEQADTSGAFNDVMLSAGDCTGYLTEGPDMFYKVGLTAGKTYRFALDGPKFNEALYLFSSCAKVAGTCGAGMGADAWSGAVEELTFKPKTSGTYLVGVAGRGTGDFGTFTLKIDQYDKLANDSCAKAAALTLPAAGAATASGHNFGATDTLKLPASGCTGNDTEGGDVFHKLALSAGKTYKITVKPGATFNPAAYLLSGCSITSCLAGADLPYAGDTETIIFTPKTSGSYMVGIDSRYEPGETYSEGSYTLTVEPISAPPNDSCSAPKQLTLAASPVTEKGDTTTASDEFATLSCGNVWGPWPGPQLYYRVTLLAGKSYTVALKASFDSALYAFSAKTACSAAAIDAACKSHNADNTGSKLTDEQLTIKPSASGDWIIAVDSFASAAYGSFDLTISWK